MKPRCSNQRNQALTLVELLVIVAVLFLVFLVLAPALTVTNAAKRYAQRIACVNNLKQIGLAYSVWGNDHNNHFPMDVSVTNGGIQELLHSGMAASQVALRNYLIMSNQLATPKILNCPADEQTTVAINFNSSFSNTNISYFASPDADKSLPQTILSGDDNLSLNDVPFNSGLLNLPTNAPIAWTVERHHKTGNIGLADGGVQQLTSSSLQRTLQQTGRATNHLLIP